MDLVTPGFGLIFWTTVVFIILVLLLKKMAWTPILNNVDARNKSIEEALFSAEKARKEMENLQADNERILKDARAERDAILKEAREIKDKIVADAKEEASEQASQLIENAKASIEQEKQAAVAELKKNVAELSIGIAQSVVKKELASQDEQLKLVEGMLQDVTLN
jgi:F-type H+-transporting ATPase subunit b